MFFGLKVKKTDCLAQVGLFKYSVKLQYTVTFQLLHCVVTFGEK